MTEIQLPEFVTTDQCEETINPGSESSLSMDEDFELIMNPHLRNKHRTSTVIENMSFSRRGSIALTVNSQTEIGSASAPKDNPLTAVLKRAMFQSRKNLSLPPQQVYSPQEHWGSNQEDDSASHSPISKGGNLNIFFCKKINVN